jgi:mRNA guanylyltransferase
MSFWASIAFEEIGDHKQSMLTFFSYYVCEKSDGLRYLLYCTSDAGREIHYLIDRRNDYWYVDNIHFPISVEQPEAFHINTIIDGELVIDRRKGDQPTPKYLVFDCLILDGQSLMNRTLDKRLAYFKDRIFAPYRGLLKKYPEEVQFQHFLVELKAMQFAYATEMMFRSILPTLPHGNDGLIFTCRNTDYKHGTDPHILKWKPENENSVDFRVSMDFPVVQPDESDIAEGIRDPYPDYDAIPVFNLFVNANNDQDEWYGTMYVEEPQWEELKALGEPLEDRIVECYMDDRKRWRYMRWRDDKAKPNHISTVESVIESIQDRVTENELIASAKRIRDEWKRRAREEEERRKGHGHVGTIAPPPSGLATGLKRKHED